MKHKNCVPELVLELGWKEPSGFTTKRPTEISSHDVTCQFFIQPSTENRYHVYRNTGLSDTLVLCIYDHCSIRCANSCSEFIAKAFLPQIAYQLLRVHLFSKYS